MRSVIVTGGCGYVGSILVQMLSPKYDKVIILDPCLYGTNEVEKIKNVILYRFGLDNFLDSFPNVNWESCDGVIHLGGLSNDPLVDNNLEANMKINVELTKTLANYAISKKIKKFVFASSASVYGFDDRGDELKEDATLNPQSAYGRSKVECEEYLLNEAKELNPVITRKGTLMGISPRMRFDLVVNTLCYYAYTRGIISLYSGGECWRPLADVHDAAACYEWIFRDENYDRMKGETYNLVHKNYRISELGLYVRHLIENHPIFPKEVNIIPDYDKQENRSYRICGEKLERAGFQPRYGLKKVVDDIWVAINSGKYDLTDPIYWSAKWLRYCKRMASFSGQDYEPLCRL